MSKLLINTDKISSVLSRSPLIVVDGGSRGDLFEPMNLVTSENTTIVRFEPDSGSVNGAENQIILDKGIWSENTCIDFHIAEESSTSSCFHADEEMLSCFPDRLNYNVRKPKSIVNVAVSSIDEAFIELGLKGPDFIKLDIHGAEYEALKGGKLALDSTVVGVLVEGWHLPIHKFQKPMGVVETLLNDHHFYLFSETSYDARWPRRADTNLYSKHQKVGGEYLFLPHVASQKDIHKYDDLMAIKLIVIADLFGHHDYAYHLTGLFGSGEIISKEVRVLCEEHLKNYNRLTFIRRIKRKVAKILSERWANI